MREIKFRAWDKINKRMRYVWDGWDENTDILKDIWSFVEDYEHILMQYTGLKDKNGKECYESDKVKISLISNDHYSTISEEVIENSGTIVYDNETSQFVIKLDDEKIFDFRYFKSIWRDGFSFEVIGNIYENPELLKE